VKKKMFWSSPSRELNVVLILLVVFVFISVFVFIKTKKKINSILIFSLLSNFLFLLISLSGSSLFTIYDLIYFQYFSLFIWPIINLFLIIKYFKSSKK